MNNQEMLRQAGEAALDRVGVSKSVMTTTSMATGTEFMQRTQMERLVDLTVSQSGWLSAVSLKVRNQRSGELPRMVLNGVVTEGVDENAGATVTTHPGTDFVPYECKKFQTTWYVTYEDLRESRASGEPDFDAKVRRMFAKAMGNDMCRWALRGDTTLDTSTRLNRLLRRRDGWLKKARASAVRYTTTRGAPFDRSLFTWMQSKMPEEFRDDADLRWLMPSILDLGWTEHLADEGNSVGSQLQDDARIQRRRFEPMGIPQLIVPQLPTDAGFSIVSGSTANADLVTDNGDGTITFRVNTLFGGYNAKWANRLVSVFHNSFGTSETLTVVDTGSHLTITTAGTLGQSTVDTTAGNYTLDLASLTSCILTNPANLFMVMCDKIRAYRKWEQEWERWRIDVFYEADAGIFNENALVLQDGIAIPTFDYGDGW